MSSTEEKCSVDVLDRLHESCTGLNNCKISVVDDFGDLNPCKDLFCELQLTYNCVPNSPYFCDKMRPKDANFAATTNSRYLSTRTIKKFKDSFKCPIKLKAEKGRKILLTFERLKGRDVNHRENCAPIAVVEEEGKRPRNLCRKNQTYESSGDRIKVIILTPTDFLLRYEARGCPNLPPPEHGWAERKGQKMKMGCNYTDYTWTRYCNGTHWLKPTGNCTYARSKLTVGKLALPHGIWIAIIIGAAIVLSVVILTVGMICLRKQRKCRGIMSRGSVRETAYLSRASMEYMRKQNMVNQQNSLSRDGSRLQYLIKRTSPSHTESDYGRVQETIELYPKSVDRMNSPSVHYDFEADVQPLDGASTLSTPKRKLMATKSSNSYFVRSLIGSDAGDGPAEELISLEPIASSVPNKSNLNQARPAYNSCLNVEQIYGSKLGNESLYSRRYSADLTKFNSPTESPKIRVATYNPLKQSNLYAEKERLYHTFSAPPRRQEDFSTFCS